MRKPTEKLGFALVVLTILVFTLAPFVWAIITSLKSGSDLFQVQVVWEKLSRINYHQILTQASFVESFTNSIIVATSTTVLSLILGIFASYSLSRIRFRGRIMLLMVILSVSMFPQIAILTGLFYLIRSMGLYNSLSGLTVCYLVLVLPFTIWILRSFMKSIPKEIEEAAILDGCSPLKIIFRIFLPLLKPAIATTAILSFIAAWNEFLFALTFTLSENKRTVPVAIAMLSGASQHELPWGQIMAASVLVTLPLVLLVLAFQKHIVAGLTTGAVKG